MAEKSKFYADIGLETGQDLLVDGNATVTGNLTVNGTQTTVNSTTTSVTDSMIELANSNTSSDTLDIGIYGNYDDGLSDGGASEYTGLFRDASDSTWKLFDGLESEPTTTVNTSGTGYAKAALEVGDLSCTTLTATNSITGASLTYPTSDGSANQVIKTDGNGTLSFSDIPAGYTDSDARSAISVSGDLSYNSTTGVISYSEPTMYADSDARSAISVSGDLSYNSTTGVISYTEPTMYTDSDARSAISAGTGISYNSSTGVITNTVSNTDTTYTAGTGLTLTGTTFSSDITQYTDSDARGAISVTDAGGDGSLAYNSTTGVITYTGPSASETRAHLSAGTGISYNSSTGVISSTATSTVTLNDNYFVSSSDPTTSSNPSGGVGSLWLNSSSGEAYVCTDATTNSNTWQNIGEGTGNVQPDPDIAWLAIGGGGAGTGNYSGTMGGGGAGGMRSGTHTAVPVGTVLTATIGAGGTGVYSFGNSGQGGGDTTLTGSGLQSITSYGGGGGGGDGNDDMDGGSGGGQGYGDSAPGSGTAGQGNDGGASSTNSTGGGGGGAGAAGVDAVGSTYSPGDGGDGDTSSITGSSTYYAGGGGGGGERNGSWNQSSGGLGGGGAGGVNTNGSAGNGTAGTANTGGGGGAASKAAGGGNSGGSGGSGVVILRLLTALYSGTTTGSPTVTTDGLYTVIKFTGSGTYTV